MQFKAVKGARGAAAVAALLAVSAGMVLPAPAAHADTADRMSAARTSQALRGLWRTDGYGTVLSVRKDRVQQYETTNTSCLKGTSAKRVGEGPGRTAARYRSADGESFTLRRAIAAPNRASMHIDGSVSKRALHRIGHLPATCGRELPGDPVHTFDVFWQTFAENYPFFKAKGIDWHAVRDHYRPRIGPKTTPKELFAVLRKMIAPLYDAHVALLAGDTGTFVQVRPGTQIPTPELSAKVRKFIEKRDLKGHRLWQFANGRIGYADLPGDQGYLRVSGFAGYTGDGEYAADRAELRQALDAILTPARTLRLQGLIVDLRINGGGFDSLGLELAARLTDLPHFAYAKAARNDPADPTRFTRPQPVFVRPAPLKPRFAGPVAVLTGGSTVSAGETFTQALMNRPASTVRIGQPTQGVFSDTLERRLPNGWRFMLPNEEYRTLTGRTFDGTGIPPHIPEPVFTDEEFKQNRDSAFDRARGELRR